MGEYTDEDYVQFQKLAELLDSPVVWKAFYEMRFRRGVMKAIEDQEQKEREARG